MAKIKNTTEKLDPELDITNFAFFKASLREAVKKNFQTLEFVQRGEVWVSTNFFPLLMFGHIFNGEGGQSPLSKVVFEKKFVVLLLKNPWSFFS